MTETYSQPYLSHSPLLMCENEKMIVLTKSMNLKGGGAEVLFMRFCIDKLASKECTDKNSSYLMFILDSNNIKVQIHEAE